MPRSKPLGWPRYMIAKRTKKGVVSYYWNLPTWADQKGCPLTREALGSDYATAKKRCDDVLNPQFDAWRKGSDPEPILRNLKGTFDWLVIRFQDTPQYRRIAEKTQADYSYVLERLANYQLKDGRRLGNVHLNSVTPGVADLLYEALKKPTQPGGKERTRTAVKAMVIARRAWNAVHRAESDIVPFQNPFAKMELKYKAKPTRLVRHHELMRMVEVADRFGLYSIGTAMMIAYYWLMREEDILKRLTWNHYRPADRPDVVRIIHHKTGELVDIPLYDEDGTPLWPELMERLDRAPRYGPVITTRETPDRKRKTHLPWEPDYFRHQFVKIREEAGLPPDVTFSGLRHGGITEGADAGLSDAQMRALSGHLTSAALLRYAQKTQKQRLDAARLRREARTKQQRMSE